MLKNIFIISKQYVNENDTNLGVFFNLKPTRLSRLNFQDFISWYEEKYEENWKYISETPFYGFRLVFFEESLCFKNNKLYPRYPWNENFKKELVNNKESFFFLNENIYLKEKIKKLEEEIKNIKK